jgi:hypothetical protein
LRGTPMSERYTTRQIRDRVEIGGRIYL